ncbi:Sulfotransferase family protein (plasmid) [Phaeobacter porticola]|uniref:Sulfotransferase family protein n=2 Tax=Phaeobacter porticola TaxID=1844006 RepID=A0A1L3IBE3_9RHOB|nr:Sulfotransferase family protein [Phaeobacter porticola]
MAGCAQMQNAPRRFWIKGQKHSHQSLVKQLGPAPLRCPVHRALRVTTRAAQPQCQPVITPGQRPATPSAGSPATAACKPARTDLLRLTSAPPFAKARQRIRHLLSNVEQALIMSQVSPQATATKTVAETAFEARFSPRLVAAETYHDPNDVILFMHIPKTAGMSVGKALQEAFDIFHPVSWENTNQSFRNKTRKALYRRSDAANPCRQVLMGHFAWSDVMYWRHQELPLKCATIIRDPLDRFVSNYRYNTSDKHPQHEAFAARYPTLESYARVLPYDYQLSLMAGAFYSFDHALEKLNAAYSFIGVTEHLGASLQHFRRSHGLAELTEHRENTGNQAKAAEDIPDAVRNIVGEKSRNDARLHQLARRCYG